MYAQVLDSAEVFTIAIILSSIIDILLAAMLKVVEMLDIKILKMFWLLIVII